MHRFMEIFKRHPWWIVGGVVAVVILIWLMTRGSGGTQTAVVSLGPSDTQIAANAAVQKAQIETNAETVQAQIDLEKNEQNNTTAVALAGVSSGINSNNNAAALALAQTNAGAAVQINAANVAGATTIAQANADAAIAINRDDNQTQLAIQDDYLDTMLQTKSIDAVIASMNNSLAASLADSNNDTWAAAQPKKK